MADGTQLERLTASIEKLNRLRKLYREKEAQMIVTMCQPAVIDMVLNRLHVAKHEAQSGRCAGHMALAAADAILGEQP